MQSKNFQHSPIQRQTSHLFAPRSIKRENNFYLKNMTRSVFFSFHYQRDIMRVQQIKQHYVTKGSYTETGFFDGSLEEKAKKEGDAVVKNLIDKGLVGSS